MGREYKKRYKELTGRPAVYGQDVISVGTTSVSGVATHTALGRDSITSWIAPQKAKLDMAVVHVAPTLTEGQLDVAVSVGGDVKASGALTPSTFANSRAWVWSAEKANQIVVNSGDAVEVFYAISTALSQGVTARNLEVRALLTYYEAE